MFARPIVLPLLLVLPHVAYSQQPSRDVLLAFRSELVERIQKIDSSQVSGRDAVTLHLAVSGALYEADERELAATAFQKAIQAAEADERRHRFTLFRHALKINDWKTAAEIAAKQNDPFLDRIAVEKYRQGDDDALDGFPHAELDFHTALDLADAYAKREEYEKLELFVTSIESLPSNEPTDVGAIIWSRIAADFREQGKTAEAKEFIDKAMKIGGGNYYTGYAVRVARLSIHGGLKEEAEKYAKLAVAYRGHHTRELLARLINELVAAGHFNLAERTLDYYPTPKERLSGERYLALHFAEQRKFGDATRIARAIPDMATAASARAFVAVQMLEAGQSDSASKLALEANDLLAQVADESAEYVRRRVIGLLGRLNDRKRVLQLIDSAGSPLEQAQRTAAAIEGTRAQIDSSQDND